MPINDGFFIRTFLLKIIVLRKSERWEERENEGERVRGRERGRERGGVKGRGRERLTELTDLLNKDKARRC